MRWRASRSLPARGEGWYCTPDDVVGQHVYFTRQGGASGLRERHYLFDVSTGHVVAATDQMYADDIRSHSRALVLGDSWRTATPPLQVRFGVVGSRLVPTEWISGPPDQQDPGNVPTRAFDTATGRPVRLRLPEGATPILQDPLAGWGGFILFQWLDDDTIALVQSYEQRPVGGDIITCHLSDGRCHLAVPAGPPDKIRMVPGASYPQ
jgi:hypothetical protein